MDSNRFNIHRFTLLWVVALLMATPGNAFEANKYLPTRLLRTSSHIRLRAGDDSHSPVDDDRHDATILERDSLSFGRHRRAFLFQTMGVLTSATIVKNVQPANADPSIISSIQGPIQDVIAPGHWIGQFVGINSKTEQWKFPNATPEEVSKAIVNVLEDLTPAQKSKLYIPNFDITRSDSTNVHVRTWTKNEWLDSLDVTLSQKSTTTIAKASFYATGFFPTSVPFAPVLNIGMSWMPFGSPGPRGEMLQDFRLRVLESLVSKRLQNPNTEINS